MLKSENVGEVGASPASRHDRAADLVVSSSKQDHGFLDLVPLILPVALQFGVHPVHLGIIFLATMQLGYITPPVGLNLFIASYRFDRPIIELYLSTLPFFFILLISSILIAFWPTLSLALLG